MSISLTDVVQNQQLIAVSTSAQILVNGELIGIIQTLEPSQDRATTPVRGVGTGDRIIERVWGLTEYKLSVQKMALFKKRMINMFGYGDTFRMLAQLRVPIDISVISLLPDNTNAYTTVYRGCHMTSHSAPIQITGEIIITENAQFDVTSIDNGDSSWDYPVGV